MTVEERPASRAALPWAITDAGYECVVDMLRRRREVSDEALLAHAGRPLKSAERVELRDGVGIIRIQGPLAAYDSWWWSYCGGSSYQGIREDLASVLDSPEAHSIVLLVDSPGGDVTMLGELADAIFAARDRKPLVAYVGGTSASAAYWLASAASEIVIQPTSVLGSIGVRTVLFDDSEWEKKLGFKVVDVVSKQSPFKVVDPSKPEDVARVQRRVDDLAGVFVSSVARHRGVDEKVVLSDFGRGDVLVGTAAIEAGLADRFGDMEELIAELAHARTAAPSFARARASIQETPMRRRGAAKAATGSASIDAEKCDSCGKKMSEAEATYCSGCYEEDDDEDDAMAAALAGTGKTRAERIERAKALATLEKGVLAIAGGTDVAAALGKLRAGVEALGERDQLRLEAADRERARIQGEFKAALEGALAGPRPSLTLGQLGKVIPTLLDEEPGKAALEAIEKVPTQTADALLAAICAAPVSPSALTRTKAFLAAQSPQLPRASVEPPPDKKNRTAVLGAAKGELVKFGLSATDIDAYGDMTTMADLEEHADARRKALGAGSR